VVRVPTASRPRTRTRGCGPTQPPQAGSTHLSPVAVGSTLPASTVMTAYDVMTVRRYKTQSLLCVPRCTGWA
jgi:hypothetical protein